MRLSYPAVVFSVVVSPAVGADGPLTATDIKQQVIGKSWLA